MGPVKKYIIGLCRKDIAVFSSMRVKQGGFLIALLAAAVISYLASAFDTFPGDAGAAERFQAHRSGWLDDAAIVASSLSQFWVAIASILAFSVVLWLARRRADAVAVLLLLGPEAITVGLKELVDRPRPEFSLLASPSHNPSFPSGHAMHAVLLFGLMMVVVEELVEPVRLRRAVQGTLFLMTLACGASRVYLGKHWPSDVLGGFLIGALFLVAILWARKRLLTGASSNFFRK